MKFNEQWLREWVNPAVNTQDMAHQLTMAGLEVDAIEPVAAEFSKIVIGEVLSVEKHPDADKLRICKVDVGEAEPLNIVCGASNVARGVKVPAALVGAVLPSGMKIKKSKLRGELSFGMLCSAVELGLAEDADGLMILPANADVGMDIRKYLGLDDVSIEIGLTPNRGDCLSVLGIAREVGVAHAMALNEVEINNVAIGTQDKFPLKVLAPDACPRYLGRVIKGVNVNATTPLWMQERLRRCGVRSLGPIVDITNYVMLELGQPMHAFDLAKLNGEVCVRMAENNEQITLLDGQEITLSDNTLVIADADVPIAMAGIMGGKDSSVTDDTKDIFLESAFFSPEAIVGRARQYGLHTDSSHRFERGVDFDMPVKAIKRASDLLLQITGGQAGPLIEVNSAADLPVRRAITLRSERINRLLGVDVPAAQVTEILSHLGMKVCEQGKEWIVTPPSFRFDIVIEPDLIEEVGRIYGYDNIKTTSPIAELSSKLDNEIVQSKRRISQIMVDAGYQEAITYSFVDPAIQGVLVPTEEGIALANPISADLSVMRTSLWSGLTQALVYNQKRQQSRIRLFEIGVKFLGNVSDICEEKTIAGIVAGSTYPLQWGEKVRNVDYFDVKGDVESLLSLVGGADAFVFTPSAENPALHPGQAAVIYSLEGKHVGWVGAMHPSVAKKLGINGRAYLFELAYDIFDCGVLPKFEDLSKFPAVKRDLALVMDEGVSAKSVQDIIAQSAGEYLTKLELFDVYRGEGIESGRKSLALGLTFQDTSRTLTDDEIEAMITTILGRLTQELEATLRE